VVLAIMASLLVTVPAWAAGCNLIAQPPFQSGNNVMSFYGRGDSCANQATVTGRLKHQKIGPDSVLSTRSFTGTNFEKELSSACLGSGAVYYTESTSSTGATAMSATRQACG
jgi:hypothetical protein